MSIIAGYLLPHAPVFIEKVGGDQVKRVENTINAYRKVAGEIEQMHPDLIVIISPHGPIFSDAIAVYDLDEYNGNMIGFGEYTLNYHAHKDSDFIKMLIEESRKQEGYFYPLSSSQFKKFQHEPLLDHGITVPLHFLKEKLLEVNLVAMSYGSLSYLELMNNGEILNKVIEKQGKRVVIIASGDMSHALSSKGPYTFNPDGVWFDQTIKASIEAQDPYQIFYEDINRIQNASECGLRSYAILLGALNRFKLNSEVIHYEGPFGVGYLIAKFLPESIGEMNSIAKLTDKIRLDLERSKQNAHVFVQIATEMIAYYVKEQLPAKWQYRDGEVIVNGKVFDVHGFEKQIEAPHGTFVSIKKQGVLRGCIGTISPTQKSMLSEILANAISACSRDYRFDAITTSELSQLSITVDVLSELSVVENRALLDPKVYGVVVYSKRKKGVLLPDLEGVDSAAEQLQIASNKGGFTVDEIDRIDCFTVERFY